MRKPCCEKEGINKGAWSKQEDEKLIGYIKTHGEGCWRSLPQAAGLHRCGKSCRLRWINYLRPDIKRGNFAQDEEDLIIKLHALLGNRWSLIAGRLPGRTDNEVKNYWNSHIRKKLLRMGIDPNNHKPHQRIPPTTTTPFSNQKMTTTNQLLSDPATTPTSSSESLNVVVDQSTPPPPARPVPHHHLGGNRDNNNNNNNDNMKLVSEASISCVDDDTPQALLDLNLDLTIAVPSSPSQKQQVLGDDCDQVQQTDSTTATMKANQVEAAARRSPTLLLFS